MRPKLAAVVLAAVLPLLLFLAHVAHEHRRLLLADVDARLVKAARHVAARHDQLVAGLEQTLTALRGARPLLGDDRAACHDRLADTVADDPRYSNMILIEEGGAVVCNARGAPLASVPADAPALAALAIGEPVVGKTRRSARTGLPILPVAVPLRTPPGKPRRVLAGALRLDWLALNLRPGELPRGALLAVVDGDGGLVTSDFASGAAPPWRDLVPAGALSAALAWRDLRLGAARASRGDFLAVVALPRGAALAGVNDLTSRLLATGLAAVVVAAALATTAADRLIIRPVARLAAAASRLEAGDLRAADGVGRGRDEIAAIGRSLARMARGLAAKIDGLADGEAAARLAASRDPVTGAVNRRGFDARLGQTVAEARAEGARLCLLAVDLDRFKEVNDTHGHAAGDRVLAVVAARLAAQVRDTDWVARLGGDEFAVVLGDVDDRETAFGIAERIIHAVEQPVAGDGDRILSVGASVGVAFFPDDAVDPAGLRQAADDALYAAKRAGRGRWHAAVAGAARVGAAIRA